MRGDRLKSARELRGLSQQDLADRSRTTLKQVWRYENGENDPTSEALTRLARALEVSMDYLAGLVDEPTSHLEDGQLCPLERRLIYAWRHGYIVEAYEALTAGFKEINQANVPSEQVAVDSKPLQSG